MFRMPQIKPITYAILTGIVSAVVGIAWLFGAVITQGGELSAVKDITLDLLIGTVILLTLGWLYCGTIPRSAALSTRNRRGTTKTR